MLDPSFYAAALMGGLAAGNAGLADAPGPLPDRARLDKMVGTSVPPTTSQHPTTGMSKHPIYLPDQPRPKGAYSPAIRAGDLLFVSGQVPTDPATGEIVAGDVAEQTRAVIANLRRVLEAAGAGLEDLVAVTVYLDDIEDWDAFNEAYRAEMPEPRPSRTTLGAGLHGFLVEISAIAYVGG